MTPISVDEQVGCSTARCAFSTAGNLGATCSATHCVASRTGTFVMPRFFSATTTPSVHETLSHTSGSLPLSVASTTQEASFSLIVW